MGGKVRAWEQAGRPVMRSPGRPPVGRVDHRRWFWEAIAEGASSEAAAAAAGVSGPVGVRWFREGGGMPSVSLAAPSARYLCFAEREEIALLRAEGCGVREIARWMGRSPSTISRELRRNAATRGGRLDYRASVAQWHAEQRAKRPKPAKMAVNERLREYVQERLAGEVQRPDGAPVAAPLVAWKGRRHGPRKDRRWGRAWRPEQISGRLPLDFPDDPAMRISHEAIYQSLYVQGRGALRRELTACLRSGRALRVPRAGTSGRGKGFVRPEIMISERPAEAGDRAVPGHWEGDLIIGKDGRTAIGTLVERATRYCLLLHLPHRHGAEQVRDAMITTIATLPTHLWRSLTWDRGIEMARHREITIATGLPIYFADPHSPWQRGSNENTNGLLRQYFPKGTDLSVHTREHLDAVAIELNGRPRETLDWASPAQAMNKLLSEPFNTAGVAFTP